MTRSPTSRLLSLWARLSPLPGGRWIFSRALGVIVPYSGTVGAMVTEFGAGRAEVRIRERRRLRNHLGSVHAVALANLGELATGLAVISALPPGSRGIVTSLHIAFHKKARGVLTCRCATRLPPSDGERVEHRVSAAILDEAGDSVADVTATWLLGSDPRAPKP